MQKIQVFAEYRLAEGHRDAFMRMLPELERRLREWGAEAISVYEGADQENLIVEQFWVQNMESYFKIKEARKSGESDFWERVNGCILGGKEKLHLWAFKNIFNGQSNGGHA